MKKAHTRWSRKFCADRCHVCDWPPRAEIRLISTDCYGGDSQITYTALPKLLRRTYASYSTAIQASHAVFRRHLDSFPEADDARNQRDAFADVNLKVNELLHRRIDIADIVSAHRLAIEKAQRIGFEKLLLSATTPFDRSDGARKIRHQETPRFNRSRPGEYRRGSSRPMVRRCDD